MSSRMMIRDGLDHSGNPEVITIQSGRIVIVDAEGRIIFGIELIDGHSIKVQGVEMTRDGDQIFEESIAVLPKAGNTVIISKLPYTE